MATISATATATIVFAAAAARSGLVQQRRVAARAERLRCGYSKEGLKACEALNLSPAVLKGLGLRRSSVPWGPRLVEERTDEEDMRLWRFTRVLNPEWILACVVGHILFNPRRFQHHCRHNHLLPPPSSPLNSRSDDP